MSALDYTVGDIITYQPFGGGTRRVRVTERHADIKNGRPGFDGTVLGDSLPGNPGNLGGAVWGYDDQILTVSRRVTRPVGGA